MQSKPRHRDAKNLKGKCLKLTSNLQPDTIMEVGCLHDVLLEPSNKMTIQLSRDPMSTENMTLEYALTDMFGDYI